MPTKNVSQQPIPSNTNFITNPTINPQLITMTTPLPLELITLLASSFLGGFMRIWGAAINARRQQHLMNIQALKTQASIIKDARQYENKAFQWTRRLIALTSVFFVIAFPKIIAVFFPHVPICIGYPEISKGFLFFTSDISKVQWIHISGLVITPLDTHLLSAIIGLYFGGSLIGNH